MKAVIFLKKGSILVYNNTVCTQPIHHPCMAGLGYSCPASSYKLTMITASLC